MVLPRASGLSSAFSRTVLRRAGAQARARASRQIGRRTYASGHGEQQSSELPWIIGSVAVTVPAAGYLWTQGPKKGEHGHGSHDEHHEEKDEEAEEEKDESGDDKAEEESESEPEPEQKEEDRGEEKQEGGDESEAKEESQDSEEKTSDSSDDVPEDEKPSAGSPGQINWDSSSNKGPGEGQKGERERSEKKIEKDSASHYSGAKHPYLDDPEKSKKGAGPTETAKIHGTVDTSQQPAR